eukprot:TRINITY_DN56017_c0_g1_i2.p1 TRINITY_DN56017_c0_g1~~TRINITY_DN56017_c0_g1_i2.p1  ORF type:complete len:309 (+),score=57.83 TRINITY_DN56017_c0_g1_i2:95-1021(+)
MPTRKSLDGSAWQPDGDASSCSLCERSFGFTSRRHHCRGCGQLVCSRCCSFVSGSRAEQYPDGHAIESKLRFCSECMLAHGHTMASVSPEQPDSPPDPLSQSSPSLLSQPRSKHRLTQQLATKDAEVWESALEAVELKRCAQLQQHREETQRRAVRVISVGLQLLCRTLGRDHRSNALQHWWEKARYVGVPQAKLLVCAQQMCELRREFNQLRNDAAEMLSTLQRDSIDGQIEQISKAGMRLSGSSQSQPTLLLMPDFDPKATSTKQQPCDCLLYTSDAADEEDSVDLGGRRIIKKKIKSIKKQICRH